MAGNNGAALGNAGFGGGMVGQAFTLDGNGGTAIQLSNTPSLRLQNFTIETWIQRSSGTDVSYDGSGIGVIFGYGSAGYALYLDPTGRPVLTKVAVSDTRVEATITDTGFHHLAVTKSGTNVVFYIDGTRYTAPAYDPGFVFSTGVAIGARGDNFGNSFLGSIDEVTVYNRALTDTEVRAIYAAGVAGKCSGPTPPGITAQPSDETVAAGATASFTVLAAGSNPLFYQWQFQGANLPGATNYIFSTTNVQAAKAGAYQVVVTNAFGAITSDVATLTLQSPPVITSQPQNVFVIPGTSVFFLVGFSGTPPLNFQWRLRGTNLPEAKHYYLSITNAQLVNAGSYTVTITNAFGSVTSAPATLTLGLPPSIVSQPVSQTNAAGANPAFNVVASGQGTLNYQWRLGGTNLVGATNAVLALNNVQVTNAGTYSAIVSNAYGAAVSSNAVLTITNPTCAAPPSGLIGWWQAEDSTADAVSGIPGGFIGNPTYVTGKVGRAFSFDGSGDAVLVGNPAPLRVQDLTIEAWIKRFSSSIATHDPSGIGVIFGFGTGGYALYLDPNGVPTLTSVEVDAVNTNVTITDTNWHHLAVTRSGSNVVFYVDGVAYPAPAYATQFTFSTSAAIGARGDVFANNFLGWIDEVSIFNRALTPDEVRALYSTTSLGKCSYPLSWYVQPANQVTTIGSNATFTAAVGGSRPIRYQWYQNQAAISGATNPVLTLSGVTYYQAGVYSLAATNSTSFVLSSNATLTLLSAPLLSNGSFETGGFDGWVISDISSPLTPIGIHTGGYNSGYGFFNAAPTDGNYCLTCGFDGGGPGRIRAAFDVQLPPGPVTLMFSYRAAWDMRNFGPATNPRTFVITIEPAGGGTALQTNTILTALAGTADEDTGNLRASVSLSAFSGRPIRVCFDLNIPEYFTGPGFFQLDNVVLSYLPSPPLAISRAGSNVILSWPAYFSNFAAIATTNVSPPISWATIGTNGIVHGATNNSLTLPANARSQIYRLQSQ